MRKTIFAAAMAWALLASATLAMDEVGVPEGADWRAEPNRGVVKDNHWRWTLRSVERVGDTLTVTLHFKNNASTARPLLLEDNYLEAIVLIDKDWLPISEGTSLYIRPTFISTEASLLVKPSDTYLFYIILSPVGSYYKEGMNPPRIYATDEYVRAPRGGAGAVKTSGNYAPTLVAAGEAMSRGYTQVLWLDSAEQKYIEEVGTSNIFFLIEDELVTPPLGGTILPGVTRDSVIQIAKHWKLKIGSIGWIN